jgi:AcrR family transcriptional regulator
MMELTTQLAFAMLNRMATRNASGPRKEPTQRRSRALVEALLGAATRVLSRRSVDQATTNEIAEVAGVSVGSLYQYFPSKQALIAALIRTRAAADVADLSAHLDLPSEVPLAEVIRRGVMAAVALHARNPTLYRVLLQAVPDLSQNDAVREIAHNGRARFTEFLRHRAHETRPIDPELVSLIIGRALEAVLHEVILEQPALLEDPRLIDELSTLCVRYIEPRQ